MICCFQLSGPVPREATRLRIYNEELGVEAHLSAMVCDYGTIELYRYVSPLQFFDVHEDLLKGSHESRDYEGRVGSICYYSSSPALLGSASG